MEKLNTSPTSPNIVAEEDRFDRLDDLLLAGSSIRKVECTEDDALGLDELLRKKDDDETSEDQTLPQSLSSSPSPSPPFVPLRPLPGRNIFNNCYNQYENDHVTTATAMTHLSPSPSAAAASAAGIVSGEILSPHPVSPPAAVKEALTSASPTPRSPILAREDNEDDGAKLWVNPTPAKPGDFLNTSISRVPSKSILKKVSSYGNFDASVSSYKTSKSSRRKSQSMDSETGAAMSMGSKKTSFLNMSMGSVSSNRSEISGGSSYGVGLDLGDSSSLVHSPRSRTASICPVDENSVQGGAYIPPLPFLPSDAQDADRAAGSASNSLDLSRSGKKMNRSVSFCSVDVREYDQTIGDNPSCRSGPPLSLDWSYSKKYEQPKALEQYEQERQDRARSLSELHVTKYRRRNLLSFNWGHSEEEMKNARKETRKLQRQRSITQTLLPLHMAHEAFISVKGFVAKKRGKAECPKEELRKITDELSKSTEDTSYDGRFSTGSKSLPGSPT